MIEWHLKSFDELTLAELYGIMRLRQEVFIVEQNCPYIDADGKDFQSHHLSGMVNGGLAAYARIVPPRISYDEVSIGRVVTSPAHRRKDYGRQLMRKAIEVTEQLYGKVSIRIGAQKYLQGFYEGFGFVDMEQPYLEDGIEHLIMLRSA